jgi:mannose-6-phosphate isomerase-like protein (cupin superfamily)
LADLENQKEMTNRYILCLAFFAATAITAASQSRGPSTPARSFEIRTGRQIADVIKDLEEKDGNHQSDVVGQKGVQMRVAVFHDEKRENDLFEVHDASDDIYYVLEGEATLMLGGTLVEPNETAPGEWRSKAGTGGQRVTIRKGDVIMVPRGTPHQRTVMGKGFSMILIKVFESRQP